jgi:very-short-patch-repair endonuclease
LGKLQENGLIRISTQQTAARGIAAKRLSMPAKPKNPVRRRVGPSALEEMFAKQIAHAGLAPVTREYQFMEGRRWRFDFAWPELRLAVEIEGGVWTNGGHTRGAGYVKNLEKYNAAAAQGWRLFRFHEGAVRNGEAISLIGPFARATVYSPGVI